MIIKDVDYFLSIAKYGNITKASKELFISQPALSKYLHVLEERVGMPLFERHNNKLTLTKAGEYYTSFARLINEQQKALEEKINRLKNKKAGKINVGLSINLAKFNFKKIIEDFKQINPNCKLNIEQLCAKDVENNVLSGIFDLAITYQPLQNFSFNYKPLFTDYLLLALPYINNLKAEAISVPQASYSWINLRQASDIPFILPNIDCRTRLYAEEAFTQSKIKPIAEISASNSANIIELVKKGVGAGIVTESDISGISDQDISFHCIGKPIIKKSVGFLTRKGHDLPLEALNFMKIIKNLFKNEAYQALAK